MAFNSNATTTTTVQSNDSWKATAFLNIYLPTPEGGKRKIGAISLKDSKAYDKALIERLSSDPEAVKAMLSVLFVDFQLADKPVAVKSLGF